MSKRKKLGQFLVLFCLPCLSILSTVWLLAPTSGCDISFHSYISPIHSFLQSNLQSLRQKNVPTLTDCPVVLVVPTQESGSLVTWLSLHALLSSKKMGSCSPKPVYIFTHSSLVTQLQHAADTWDLPHSTPVYAVEFSRFPRGDHAPPFSKQSHLLMYQSKHPVPDLQISENWMNEDTVVKYQERESPIKGSSPSFDKTRTALLMLPSTVRFSASSCFGNISIPEDIINCVEDSLHEKRDQHRSRVKWVAPRVDPFWWEEVLPTSMEKHPQCNVSRATNETNPEKNCRWMDAHTNLRHTVLPFALSFQSAFTPIGSVSLSTQMTPDRLDRLEAVVQSWAGPVSVAFYAHLEDAMTLPSLIAASDVLRHRPNVMFHIMGNCGPMYPVNRLRNVANRFAVTPYLLLLDVDLVPSPDTYPKLELRTSRLDSNSKEMLVIPAVEFSHKNRSDLIARPLSKEQLRPLVENGSVVFFQEESFPTGHAPTNLDKYLSSEADYFIQYAFLYEAYMLTNRLTTPPFDERYIGWGYDKLSLHAALHVLGYRFKVLSDSGFLFHVDYPGNNVTSVTWGRSQPEYLCNRGLFKAMFGKTVAWGRPKLPGGRLAERLRAERMLQECRDRGFASAGTSTRLAELEKLLQECREQGFALGGSAA